MKLRKYRVFLFICTGMLAGVWSGCEQNYTPKPYAYFRIDFPEKEYRVYDGTCPFSFDYPAYGNVVSDTRSSSESCWLDVVFPRYRGTIHLTYISIDRNFDQLLENEWDIVYKKIAQRADAIDPYDMVDEKNHLYGTVHDIRGNAASSVQFFVTDSVKNFLRGSLYFTVRPNYDSLAPAISFFKEDVMRLVESVRWKN